MTELQENRHERDPSRPDLGAGIPDAIAFFELAPENWLEMGGARRRDLRHFAARIRRPQDILERRIRAGQAVAGSLDRAADRLPLSA